MKNFLFKTLVIAGAVVLASYSLHGLAVTRFTTAVLPALLLSLFRFFVKHILILTLPFTIFSVGLFHFIVNEMIVLVMGKRVSGFSVGTSWPALLFSILLSFFTCMPEFIVEPDNKKR